MIQYINNPECLSVAEESYQGLLAHFSSFEILFITTALFLFIMIGGLLGVENKDRLFTKNSLSTGMKSIRILIDWIEGMTIIALFEMLINVVLLLFFYQNPYHLYTVMFVIVHIVLFNCKKQES
jgi:hypothetical protein